MQTGEVLRSAYAKLARHGVPSPQIDVELLMCYVLDKPRSWVLAHSTDPISVSHVSSFNALVERRALHEPIAYIIGKSEFYGREFEVTPDTLQPRPETETMIEMLLKEAGRQKMEGGVIVDVGTGSGCIAITAALELAQLPATGHKPPTILATDISSKALSVAKRNAKKHVATIDFRHGNLLEPLCNYRLPVTNLVVLANLPYVPNSHTINEAARHEPDIAIFGGEDGLDYYRELFSQISSLTNRTSWVTVYTESLPPQHNALSQIALEHGFVQADEQDFIQCFSLASNEATVQPQA